MRRYSDPLHGRHSLQIEINRGLYMDEASITRHEGFADAQGQYFTAGGRLSAITRARVLVRKADSNQWIA